MDKNIEDFKRSALTLLEALSEDFPIAREAVVKQQLTDEIDQGARDLHWELIKQDPFAEDRDLLEQAETQFKEGVYDLDSIRGDFSKFQVLIKKTDGTNDLVITTMDYWQKEIKRAEEAALKFKEKRKKKRKKGKAQKVELKARLKENRKAMRGNLQQQWRQLLDTEWSQWQLAFINERRRRLLEKLREWLEKLQTLKNFLDNLSLEPGLLFDLSKDNLSMDDINQLKRWAEYISEYEGVKKLCDMLERLRRAEKSKRLEMAKSMASVTEYLPDINSKEEIVGVCLGRDIEYVIPQERALLADEETSILFDLKFVEGRLMCFDLEGLQASTKGVERDIQIEVEDEEKLGPIIVCVDTSGSMEGAPETIAKAITLYMATRATSQKRDCLLINFSTHIETMDLSGRLGIKEVIPFLRRSFHGGTDAAPAFAHALNMMGEKKYEKSDLLIVSDFMMRNLSKELHEKISAAKATENKFYALCIGNHFLSRKLRDVFDNEWVYDPSHPGVHEVHGMLQNVADPR